MMKKKPTNAITNVKGTEIYVLRREDEDYISLTDMLKAKDGDFFISDWLCNRNTVEFLGIWVTVHNPDFNSGEFATIKSQAGLNSYKLSVKEWVEKTNAIGLRATKEKGYSCPLGKMNHGLENLCPPLKAPTGRQHNVPIESKALKGRNMGGAA